MQLFLSYSSADRTSVIAVQKLLQGRGINTFLDRSNLVSGLPWPQALEQALRAVNGVAVFIGCELGGWQKREMWFALDRQVRQEKEGRLFPVIPVLLHGADLTPGFLFLNTWVDLRRGLDDVFTAEALSVFEQAIKATQPVRHYEDSAVRVVEYPAATICPYRGLHGISGTKYTLPVSCPRNKHAFRPAEAGSVGCFSRRERRAYLNRYVRSEQRGKTANWRRPRGLR